MPNDIDQAAAAVAKWISDTVLIVGHAVGIHHGVSCDAGAKIVADRLMKLPTPQGDVDCMKNILRACLEELERPTI